MALFFLASIAGLFPALTLPLGVGWKALHVFDLLFIACLGFAAMKRAVRAPDWRLIATGAALVAALGVSLWAHPSQEGVRSVIRLAYSVVVLLAVSHVRLDVIGIRIDRTILWPLFIAVGIAWVVFLVENMSGVAIGFNNPRSLPAGVHRLGGFTGANALILFLCLGGPFVRAPALILVGILLTAFATLSRSLLGVGVALVMRHNAPTVRPDPTRRALLSASWLGVALGLFAYGFAVVPVTASHRTTFRLSLDAGGYLTLHQAAVRMLRASPLVGVGPAQFVKEYRSFTSQEERDRVFEDDVPGWAPHSAALGLAAEQGLLGLAVFAWLIYEIYRRLARISDPELRAAAIAGLTGLLAGGHFVDWLTLKGLWLWIGLMVASRSK